MSAKAYLNLLIRVCFIVGILMILSCQSQEKSSDDNKKRGIQTSTESEGKPAGKVNPHLRSNLKLPRVPSNTFTQMGNGDFSSEQLQYLRVREAYQSHQDTVQALLFRKGIKTAQIDLFLRLFKKAEILEVWANTTQADTFQHLVDYPFCSSSGTLGPKRQEGDGQIPEGFYRISYFNPRSNYHLSLKINYPNRLDRIRGHPQTPGGNIFIHGNCVTIGCVPITDPYIKELYVLAVEARNSGNARIPVHVYPAKMNDRKWQDLKSQYKGRDSLLNFWGNLREGYQAFQQTKTIPDVSIREKGYVFR